MCFAQPYRICHKTSFLLSFASWLLFPPHAPISIYSHRTQLTVRRVRMRACMGKRFSPPLVLVQHHERFNVLGKIQHAHTVFTLFYWLYLYSSSVLAQSLTGSHRNRCSASRQTFRNRTIRTIQKKPFYTTYYIRFFFLSFFCFIRLYYILAVRFSIGIPIRPVYMRKTTKWVFENSQTYYEWKMDGGAGTLYLCCKII